MLSEPTVHVPQNRPRLLDQVRSEIRKRHYSRRTEETYIHWVRRYILFNGTRHPADVSTYLSKNPVTIVSGCCTLQELAEEGQTVKGVIIALEDDQRLRRALAATPNIAFYRYQISFKLLKG